ncbi:MAG: DUF1292 domain-containing protein [Oscillospiraceae bacterium]|nr:DUF1292 domain-containing protein [Oscillospiraceae bacterium]
MVEEQAFGVNIYSVTGDDGQEHRLEHLFTFEVDSEEYMAFCPADMTEEDPDYGVVLLRVVEEDGEELFETIDDKKKLEKVYEAYMELLFDEDADE